MEENNRLHSEKIPKLLFSLAAPAICAPIVTVVTAFTGLLGRGGSPLAAIRIGEGNHEAAERYLGNSFVMLILSSVIIMALTLLFRKPLLM